MRIQFTKRILADRGTEYCGSIDQHEYRSYLAMNDIDHAKTKAMSTKKNGICERCHKTILNELYQITFLKKLYSYMEPLHKNLDEWVVCFTMNEFIKARCNTAEHQWELCLKLDRFGP